MAKNKNWDHAESFFSNGYQPQQAKRCYHSHPPLPLCDGLVIYGGSCINPAVKDADVYVGFDGGQRFQDAFPWDGKIQTHFYIQDMNVPDCPDETRQLLYWTEKKLRAGKKVHMGCIGGHGRTGLIFSALVSIMMPEIESPTEYVREHYCKKAVESAKQVEWLHKHFGIKKVAGAKEHLVRRPSTTSSKYTKKSAKGLSLGGSKGSQGNNAPFTPGTSKSAAGKALSVPSFGAKTNTSKYAVEAEIEPLAGPDSVWHQPTKK